MLPLLKVVLSECGTWNYHSHFAILRIAGVKRIEEWHIGDVEGICILGYCDRAEMTNLTAHLPADFVLQKKFFLFK